MKMATINQKEYLKKYLGIGKAPGEKKKKKKKEKTLGNRLKIIDDDVDVLISQEIQDDLSAANEDAPQIVAIIDDRPPSLQVDEKTKSSLWKPIGEPSNVPQNIQELKVNSFKLSKQVKSADGNISVKKESVTESYNRYTSSNDRNGSVSRVKQENYGELSSLSPQRYEDDYSPPRKLQRKDTSPDRRKNRERSLSPRIKTESHSPLRGRNKNASSPPRRRNMEEDSSPPRRRNNEEDTSPPRRRNKREDSSPKRRNKEENRSLKRRNIEEDTSPPRRRNKEDDSSPPRRRNKDDSSPPRRRSEEDSSPPRKRNKGEDSPPPKKQNRERDDVARKYAEVSSSPGRRNKDTSPSREEKRKRERSKKTRWNSEEPSDASDKEKMTKTLDGKQAGLQNAKDLLKESKFLRQREDELFQNMSAEVSGRNAATVVRGKKTKNLEEEAAKAKREKEMKEKYDRWGKGLKQVEDQSKIMEEQLHEMSKPLARYADDEDLEKFLKEQEREGDPMLAYIRKKKKKEKVAAGIPEKPMYMGEFMPNRFGIRPGYRWDGVDRSNGYEKKWFQVQNAKKASREEAFKWSTEDM